MTRFSIYITGFLGIAALICAMETCRTGIFSELSLLLALSGIHLFWMGMAFSVNFQYKDCIRQYDASHYKYTYLFFDISVKILLMVVLFFSIMFLISEKNSIRFGGFFVTYTTAVQLGEYVLAYYSSVLLLMFHIIRKITVNKV